MKYSVILFLLLCEITFGQFPGSPRFTGTNASPKVYTLYMSGHLNRLQETYHQN